MKTLLVLFLGGALAASSAGKPNVLLLMVNDLKPALACYADPAASTPKIDAFAATAMRFEFAYCNQAANGPSRYNLMLGSHSTSTGLYHREQKLREVMPGAITLPQYFSKHGYTTESLGMVFHVGHGNEGDPDSWSVPPFRGRMADYILPASNNRRMSRIEALYSNLKLPKPIEEFGRGAAWEAPEGVSDPAYADGRLAKAVSDRLEAAAEGGEPFFIACGFVRPHLPFNAPKRYWDRHDPGELPGPRIEEPPAGAPAGAVRPNDEIASYKEIPEDGVIEDEELKRQLVHGYYASASYMDAQVGKVLAELEQRGLDDNTIVVLWSDNGYHLGDHGFWGKYSNYEEANRIPLLIRAPGVTKGSSTTRQIAQTVDLFPTLCELAGLPTPKVPQPLDGVSLVPVLKDQDKRLRDHAYHAQPLDRLGRAIRTERYRLVEWRNPGEDEESAVVELYDYEEDPLETRNLAEDKPDVVKELKAILAKYPEPKPVPAASAE